MATQNKGSNRERSNRNLKPFAEGQSGNPGGRPSLPEAFKKKGPGALKKLAEFMTDKDHRIALRATELVAERIYGKPTQPLEHDAGREMLDVLAEKLQARLEKGD